MVNLNPSEPRLVTVQAGAYGEHKVISISDGKWKQPVNDCAFTVRLAPGAGAKLTVLMKRFANEPTLYPPWGRAV